MTPLSHRLNLLVSSLALAALPCAAAAACPAPTSTADVGAALERAETAYARLDVEGFRDATDHAREALPCLADPVPRSLAAGLHRFQGLRAFIDRDPDLAARAFAAARAIEPDYRFPERLIPAGNPVEQAYDAVDPALGASLTVPAPASGHLAFDGRRTRERPTSWPTVAQRFDDTGAVVETAWLQPSDPLFGYPEAPVNAPSVRRPLLFGAAGGAVTSIALMVVAGSTSAAYRDPDTSLDRVGGLRATTNALVIASALTGVGAAGVAGYAIVGPDR